MTAAWIHIYKGSLELTNETATLLLATQRMDLFTKDFYQLAF